MKTVAGMVAVPGREKAGLEALESLSDVVDEIHLALNQRNALPNSRPAGGRAALTDGGEEKKLRSSGMCMTAERGMPLHLEASAAAALARLHDAAPAR